MITVHDIHKAYGAKAVLKGVNACFPARSLTSLIGPMARARPRCC